MVQFSPLVSVRPFSGDGIAQSTQDQIATVRVLLAAASNPEVSLDIEGLAEASKLSTDAVRELLCSPTYKKMVAELARERVSTIVTRGLCRMSTLIDEGTPAQAISAMNAVTAAYRALHSDVPKIQSSEEAMLMTTALLRRIDQARKIHASEPEHLPSEEHTR